MKLLNPEKLVVPVLFKLNPEKSKLFKLSLFQLGEKLKLSKLLLLNDEEKSKLSLFQADEKSKESKLLLLNADDKSKLLKADD